MYTARQQIEEIVKQCCKQHQSLVQLITTNMKTHPQHMVKPHQQSSDNLQTKVATTTGANNSTGASTSNTPWYDKAWQVCCCYCC
jgi:hypothetical protein